jgi:LuxR family maltose regulon positive regulatory protein
MRAFERTAGARPPSTVVRTALFERLAAGCACGLTLVSAPAGSGKTVLLRSWIEAAGLDDQTAWVAVERDERDGQRFWLSIVEALRGIAVAAGPIEDLAAGPRLDGEAVVERIAAWGRTLDGPILLVIDDVHQLADLTTLAQLEHLLARRPPQLRVMLSTRHDPPLGLHRYRVAGELVEVRAADLRFGLDETRQLLTAAGVTLSDDAADALLARTEGWAAGLRLAALSLAGDPDPERFVAEFSGSARTVADYLFAEVLQHEPEPVRRLLLGTSILERVCGSLADRLLGTSGSERILLELEAAGAFVYPIDTDRSWFRYHHLFTDLLRLELRRTSPDSVALLHHAAAEWFAEHGLITDAIKHAQAAEDWRLAGDLLGQYGFSLALDGSYSGMEALLDPFPADALANPELAAFLAYGEVMRPSLDTAAAYIAIAERRAADVPEERRRRFQAMLATTRLSIARWRGDSSTFESEVAALLEPIEAESVSEVAAANDVRAVSLMNLGAVELWAGAGDDAERHLREALELTRRNRRPFLEMGCLGHLAIAVGRRSFAAQRELAAQTLAIIERFGWTGEAITPMVLATLAAADVWQGRFEDAQPWLDRAERLLQPDAEPSKAVVVRWTHGIQDLGQGRLAKAVAAFAEVGRLQSLMVDPDPLATSARGLRVQTLVRLGLVAEARTVLATASDAERDHADTRTALAAIRLAERDAGGAIDALAPVLAGEAPVVRDFSVVNAVLIDALAREALGDAQAAEDDIERALDLAEPDALILPFVIAPARELLGRHPRHRTAHAALLANILDALTGSSVRVRGGEAPELQEELTESELRVLRYLPSNLSAPEIAAEMVLSTSTVKTHMNHIYEKLGAHKRTEAVERARDLGLLGPSARVRR